MRPVSSTQTFTMSGLKPARILATASSLVLNAAFSTLRPGFASSKPPIASGTRPSS